MNRYEDSIPKSHKSQPEWISIGAMGAAMASPFLSVAPMASPFLSVGYNSKVVFTMVRHPPDVRSIVPENEGVLLGLNEGWVVVQTTSSHPVLARTVAVEARARWCWAVDGVVSSGDVVVGWFLPLFEIMGGQTYVGVAGCGLSCKMAKHIRVGADSIGLNEELVLAGLVGLDLRQILERMRVVPAGLMVLELFGGGLEGQVGLQTAQ